MRSLQLIKRVVAVVTSVICLGSIAACGNTSSNNTSSEKINVVSSVNQWGSLAQELGGDNVQVTNILNNVNVDAHDYEPTSGDIAKISSAQLVVVNGGHYDEWAAKAAKNSQATFIDVADEISLDHDANSHLWFYAKARKAFAKSLTEAYKKIKSEKSSSFDNLYAQWEQKEQALEDTIEHTHAMLDHANYAATESVVEYLMNEIGVEDKTPTGYKQAAANESEPSASDINEFIAVIKNGSLKFLVVNTQEENNTTAQLIKAAKEANVPIVEVSEQKPEQYKNIYDWLTAIVNEIHA
ncbi:MAG: zinc ABC transporter substrate-binding protein [Bifidobacteriaceae bacterium]|nr:zinc ABC transporter substrate-binding protein [Bifidobacteriaceae bacterium]